MFKNFKWWEVNQLAINFTSMAEDLNSGLQRTNPARSQSGT